MRMRFAQQFLVAAILATAQPTIVMAVSPGPKPPGTPSPQPGPITVQYRDGSGGLGATTSIPSGSVFRSQGGSDRAPCQFHYLGLDPDGAGPLLAPYELRPSDRWMFKETTDQVSQLTEADWVGVAAMSGVDVASLLASYGPVEAAFRRFNVFCIGTNGSSTEVTEQLPGSVLVSIRDPFWDPYARIDRLWTGLQLDRPIAVTVPDSGLFGGLPVNMPSTLQIDAAPWKTYVSPASTYRGWTSRLVLTPESLAFDVVFDPDVGPTVSSVVSCLDGWAAQPSSGPIPKRASGVPDFAEPGQFSAPCVWIPPKPGALTVRARISYHVVFTVSGYVDVLAPYEWSSDPLTVRVDDLRVVNIRPEG
jgi:hypothetical protein